MVGCLIPLAVSAASTSVATLDWSTFAVYKGGVNVTSSITWSAPDPGVDPDQADYVTTEYIEGATTGSPVLTSHDVAPNPNWASIQSTSDGAVATDAQATVSPGVVSASSTVNYTGRADVFANRFGRFVADAGTYTFELGYSMSAAITPVNSELGGPSFSLDATPYVEFQVFNTTQGNFRFEFDDSVEVSGGFGSQATAGTLELLEDFGGNAFVFSAGDIIEISATAQTTSRSFSSQPPAVPLPGTVVLLLSSIVVLAGWKKARRS